jgi:hypothetical protein
MEVIQLAVSVAEVFRDRLNRDYLQRSFFGSVRLWNI